MQHTVRSFSGRRIVLSRDDVAPNVLYVDHEMPTILTPIDRDHYAVFRGRVRLGDIVFQDGVHRWGWRYYPRSNHLRPSRKFHPDPLAAIRHRVRLDTPAETAEVANH